MKNKRKIIAIALACAMLVGTAAATAAVPGSETPFGITVSAAEIVESGKCGENISYTLNSEGTLTIRGTGKMENYGYGDSPFDSNSDIKKIIIKDGVTGIGDRAFYNCRSLAGITIPDSVTSIGVGAFDGCTSLTSVTLPDSVTSVDAGAFYNCTSLTKITLSKKLKIIKDEAFNGCRSLTSLTIPGSVKNIGAYCFYNCESLVKVTLSDGLKSIGEEAFYGCRSVTSMTVPDSVTTIGEYAFWECALNSVTIPNNVTSIGSWAFGNCYNLTTVNILSSIVTIGNKAFMNCQKLIDVYCYAKKISNNFWSKTGLWTAPDAFLDSYPESITLHVPLASINDYKATEPWKYFKSIVALDGETTQEKCATPKISYTNGKLKFDCETEGVEFVSEITDKDIKKNYTSEVALTATYNITVYASKSGYDDSETAKATLCWIDTNPKTEGITNGVANVRAMPVMIQSQGGVLNITGAPEGSVINVYDLSGKKIDSAISSSEKTSIPTNLKSGEIGIVKIGDKSIKVVMQ